MRLNSLRAALVFIAVAASSLFPRGAMCGQANPTIAQVQKALWTSETIRSIRSGQDYQALLALLITDESLKHNIYADAGALQQAIARAAALTQNISAPSLDPDLNATTLRAMLDHLRNANVLPADSINNLVAELTKSPLVLSEEEFILRVNSVRTKDEFDSFLQSRVSSIFDKAADARASAVLAAQVGAQHLLDPHIQFTALVDQSHLPEGPLRTTLHAFAATGVLNPDDLTTAAKQALKQTSTQFDSAQSALRAIVASQPPLDAILHAAIPPGIQTKIDAARQLISSTPDQLEQFDTLRLAATILPLPANVANTIQTVAKIGAAVQSTVSTVSHVASAISSMSSIASVGLSFFTTGGLGTLAGSLGSVFGGGGPSNQDILDAINKVDSDLQDMHRDMDARFDQVDAELKKIETNIDDGFQNIENGLKVINVKLDDLVPTTHSIEALLLDERATLERAAINSIGDRNDAALQELHRRLVKLTHAVELAESGHDEMTSDKFDDLAEYYSTLARTEAAKRPFSGLQVAEDYRFDTTSTRLSADSSFYLTNFVLSFPLAEQENKPLEALLPPPAGTRYVVGSPYVNERVWILAANSIATLLEHWPNFGYEIPQSRAGYEQMKAAGKDLQTLVKALQTPEAAAPAPLSKPLAALISSYQTASAKLTSEMQQGLVDEVTAFSRTKGLSAPQTQALQAAFSSPPLPGGGRFAIPDPITGGSSYAMQNIKYEVPSLGASGCTGLNVPHTVSGTLPAGPGLNLARLSLGMNNAVLSACIEIGGPFNTHVVRKDWGGYHMSPGEQDGKAACAALTDMTVGHYIIQVDLMLRAAGDPDDAAHRIIIATSTASGPDTDLSAVVVNNIRWSGNKTDAGHNWNWECQSPHGWHAGMQAPAFTGFEAYINSNWNSFANNFAPAMFFFGTAAFANANGLNVYGTIKTKNDVDFNGIYTNFASDAVQAIDPPPPPGQSNNIAANHVAQIAATVDELNAKRALIANLSTIAFETTLQRDDVTAGLLFGTHSVLGKSAILDIIDACAANTDHGPVDTCLSTTLKIPLDQRPARVLDRLALVTSELAAGRITDNHIALQQTLDRLDADECLVPSAEDGSTCRPH
jgi:hypothetical protein